MTCFNTTQKNQSIAPTYLSESENLSYYFPSTEGKFCSGQQIFDISFKEFKFLCKPKYISDERIIIAGQYANCEEEHIVDVLIFQRNILTDSDSSDMILHHRFELAPYVKELKNIEGVILHNGCSLVFVGSTDKAHVMQLYKLGDNCTMEFIEELEFNGRFEFSHFNLPNDKVALCFSEFFNIYDFSSSRIALIYLVKCDMWMYKSISLSKDSTFVSLITNDMRFLFFNDISRPKQAISYEKLIPVDDRTYDIDDDDSIDSFEHRQYFHYQSCTIKRIDFHCMKKEEFYGVTNTGLIIDFSQTSVIGSIEKIQGINERVRIYNSEVCEFNKCLYMHDSRANKMFVFDLVHRNFVDGVTLIVDCYIAEFSVTFCGRYITYYGLSWNSSSAFIKNSVACFSAFQGKVFSLRYLSRLVLFKNYSLDTLEKMVSGKNLRHLVLDENYMK